MSLLSPAVAAMLAAGLLPPFSTTAAIPAATADPLVQAWSHPPRQAQLRAYWWWLNGHVTAASITKDLEWMKSIGMGGGLVFDAGGATMEHCDEVPAGPLFASPEWRKLFVHAAREADRLGLEIGMNLTSGWNLGAPNVDPSRAAKVVTWSQAMVRGGGPVDIALPKPATRAGVYQDTCLLAYKLRDSAPDPAPWPPASTAAGKKGEPPPAGCSQAKPIRMLREKCAYDELGGSASDCTPLLDDIPASRGEEDLSPEDVVNLTEHMDKAGRLRWDAPPGRWAILRFGYTYNGANISTSSGAWKGMVLDYMDPEAMRWYWRTWIDPIIADAGPLAGRSWTMVQTDSWELGGINWTAAMPAEFRARRGYDLLPWLPVIAGRIVGSRGASNQFLADFRRTIADCIADNHYGTMAALAHAHGLGIQPESAGPHTAPLDGIKCYGRSDWPMSEFWVWSPHRPTDETRFFVKQAASAAHVYGKPVVCAEGFTSIGPQWDDILWSSQKPAFDHEACAGLNLVFWHAFSCSPAEMGLPGQEYPPGTHFDPQLTWAGQAHAFVGYLDRCQALLQQGRFTADVLYFYGDNVPNIARRKQDDPARILPLYDYDVTDEEALLKATVRDGRITLPGGMSYRVLVTSPAPGMSLGAGRKLRELAMEGATIVGPRPRRPTGREDAAELERIAHELWDAGRVKAGTARDALAGLGVEPDVEGIPDWIHRHGEGWDIYFLSNQGKEAFAGDCVFRVAGKRPEFWDPVTGTRRLAASFTQRGERTSLRIELPPFGSMFVIFRERAATDGTGVNFAKPTPIVEIKGPWMVSFDPKWGGPAGPARFDELTSWTARPEEGIRYYSGTAAYRCTFDLPPLPPGGGGRLWLDLGSLSMLGVVRLNGADLGVTWCPPFRVEVTGALRPKDNELEIDVVNGWFNRLCKDRTLPEAQRLTRTNIVLKNGSLPIPSGLFGPVRLMSTGDWPSPVSGVKSAP